MEFYIVYPDTLETKNLGDRSLIVTIFDLIQQRAAALREIQWWDNLICFFTRFKKKSQEN